MRRIPRAEGNVGGEERRAMLYQARGLPRRPLLIGCAARFPGLFISAGSALGFVAGRTGAPGAGVGWPTNRPELEKKQAACTDTDEA